jgi:rhodanese-related sulfurtransferase
MKNLFRITSAIFCSLIFITCTAQTKTLLTVDEFESGISKDSVQILDVRTPGEYVSGHIKNTLLANWNDAAEFSRRIAFIDKKKPVYVYCLAGGRSADAAAKMRSIGFEKVYELDGGINMWKTKSKPLEGKTIVKQMTADSFNRTITLNKMVLVDFGATWCPPCKKMEPILSSIQRKYGKKLKLLKVDGGNDENLMKVNKVTALPVFIIYKDGKQIWRKDGVATGKELESVLGF